MSEAYYLPSSTLQKKHKRKDSTKETSEIMIKNYLELTKIKHWWIIALYTRIECFTKYNSSFYNYN